MEKTLWKCPDCGFIARDTAEKEAHLLENSGKPGHGIYQPENEQLNDPELLNITHEDNRYG